MLTKNSKKQYGGAVVQLPKQTADVAVPSVAQARFINLKLITSRRGSKIRLAEKTTVNPSVISHILKQRYTMTDDVASRIELAYGLSAGFLDKVHSVIEFPEFMRESMIRDDLSSVGDVLALISRQSTTPLDDTGFPTASEFEKLPSLQLDKSVLAFPLKTANPGTQVGPLVQALCLMLSQKTEQNALTEELALKIIQVLMNERHPC